MNLRLHKKLAIEATPEQGEQLVLFDDKDFQREFKYGDLVWCDSLSIPQRGVIRMNSFPNLSYVSVQFEYSSISVINKGELKLIHEFQRDKAIYSVGDKVMFNGRLPLYGEFEKMYFTTVEPCQATIIKPLTLSTSRGGYYTIFTEDPKKNMFVVWPEDLKPVGLGKKQVWPKD